MTALSLTATARAQIDRILQETVPDGAAIQVVRQLPVSEDLTKAIANGANEDVIKDLAAKHLEHPSSNEECWLGLYSISANQCRKEDLQRVGEILFCLPVPLLQALDNHSIDYQNGEFSIVRVDGDPLEDPVRSLLRPEMEG